MKYYIKKLGHQELGSVGINGRPNRGRYIYISKDEGVLNMFPPLGTVITNDSSLLPVIPLYLRNRNKVYCNFIYHNDKFTIQNGTRNEYRIYSNSALEGGQYLFADDDILILKKDSVILDGEEQTVYFMDLLNDHDTAYYRMCDELVNSSLIRGFHAIYDGRIAEMETKIDDILNLGNVDIVIDDTVTNRVGTTEQVDAMANLFNSNTFRDFVMVGYEYLCAITRTVIKFDTYMNLEAAHIKPRSHGGLFLPNNGMALCRDLHWAFDKGFFTLNDHLEVVVHPKTTSYYLREFDGHQIYIPNNPFFLPELSNIHYHRDNVYGLFLTTGRI